MKLSRERSWTVQIGRIVVLLFIRVLSVVTNVMDCRNRSL